MCISINKIIEQILIQTIIYGEGNYYKFEFFEVYFQGSADFKVRVRFSSSFNPSWGDLASPSNFTIALPTITPSAPHSVTCNKVYNWLLNNHIEL